VIRRRPTKRPQTNIFVKANHAIRFPEVRVLSEHGDMLGVMPIAEAQQMAVNSDKDLVLLTEKAEPPIVKIIDLAKHKYQMQQKQAESRKKARNQDIKEVQFSPFIGEGDFQTKLRKVTEFLTRGDKVRVTVDFKRGRTITKKEFGFEVLNKVFAATADISVIETQPQFFGKKLQAQLMPGKKHKENNEPKVEKETEKAEVEG
jgi:translation initiation factor IF-3